MITEHLLILISTAFANIVLGLAVWLKSPSQRVNKYFGLFSLTLAAWALSNGFVAAYASTPLGIVWARAAFASASLIPLSLFLFVTVFPSPNPAPPKTLTSACLLAGFGAFALSLTPLVAARTTSIDGALSVTYGPLHPFFGLYVISSLAYSLVFLARKLTVLKGIEKLQVRYVFLGAALFALCATTTNLLIPLLFKSSRFSRYGPLFSLVMNALIAHSIIRYRLMNIRLVIRRSATYALSVVTAAAVFIVLVSSASRISSVQPRELPLWAQLAFALAIALLFQPLKRSIQAWTDRYFFREPYNYQRTLREISRTMSTILDLQSLLTYACDAISKTVRPEFIAVYALDPTETVYRRLVTRKNAETNVTPRDEVLASTHLLTFVSAQRTYALADDLHRPEAPPAMQEVAKELWATGAEFILPIFDEETLVAFFLIGSKLSGDPYFSEDIDLLTTLANQAAVAIKNAQLYSQVVLINEYIENILATMESGVIAVGGNHTVSLFNAAAERMTGLKTRDVKGSAIRILPASIASALAATANDTQPRTQVETTIYDQSGRLIPVICSTSPIKDRLGTMLGAVAVFSDLTRLKQLEGEKQRAERLASIGALASGLAHEIKNPLVAIRTFAELLPERFADEDFRNDFAQIAIKEIGRIDDLVARLRGLATKPVEQFAPVDIRTSVYETLALLRGQLEQAQITAKIVAEADLRPVTGDHAQLKQLFLNVFMNAVEAMGPGGELAITLAEHFTNDLRSVIVEISDTGHGIPEHLLGKIFDPFVTTKLHGSGLGLSICRGIADAHRATIRANNNLYHSGATITIRFPLIDHAAIRVS